MASEIMKNNRVDLGERFTINEIQEMQKNLQDKYKDKWKAIGSETGKNKLLRMVREIGEVIDIVGIQLFPDGCIQLCR